MGAELDIIVSNVTILLTTYCFKEIIGGSLGCVLRVCLAGTLYKHLQLYFSNCKFSFHLTSETAIRSYCNVYDT